MFRQHDQHKGREDLSGKWKKKKINSKTFLLKSASKQCGINDCSVNTKGEILTRSDLHGPKHQYHIFLWWWTVVLNIGPFEIEASVLGGTTGMMILWLVWGLNNIIMLMKANLFQTPLKKSKMTRFRVWIEEKHFWCVILHTHRELDDITEWVFVESSCQRLWGHDLLIWEPSVLKPIRSLHKQQPRTGNRTVTDLLNKRNSNLWQPNSVPRCLLSAEDNPELCSSTAEDLCSTLAHPQRLLRVETVASPRNEAPPFAQSVFS